MSKTGFTDKKKPVSVLKKTPVKPVSPVSVKTVLNPYFQCYYTYSGTSIIAKTSIIATFCC